MYVYLLFKSTKQYLNAYFFSDVFIKQTLQQKRCNDF